jgi:hypothetical protein
VTPLLRRLLPAVLLGAAVTFAPATPVAAAAPAAPAETCPPLDLADEAAVVARAEQVDHVFVGRVADVVRRKRAGRPTVVTHEVTVTTVLSGELQLGQTVAVRFTPSAEGDQRVLGQREKHLFFTTDAVNRQRADYCAGSAPLPNGLSAKLQRTLEGYFGGPPEPPARVELHRPSGGADEPPRLSRVVAPGAAISLIGVLGLFLVARVGRNR